LGVFHPAHTDRSLSLAPGAASAKYSLRVLVVEDHPVNREVVRRMLEKRGHLVVMVNDGAHGVSEWRKGSYDVILMDVQMPVMDGATATRCIRAEEKIRGGHIPIIALTAHALKGADKECLACGMDGYISKPLRKEAFLRMVESFASANFKNQVAAKSKPGTAQPPATTQYSLSAKQSSTGTAASDEPLIQLETMAKLAGHDAGLQQKILKLCADVLSAKLPQLNRAMNKGDRATIERIVHYLRGSLGMLGLPSLIKIGEDIESHYEDLGAQAWRQRCEEFRVLLCRIDHELRQLKAA
jgi:CheY-like chemotaxis protein